jgi:hypothetical protein
MAAAFGKSYYYLYNMLRVSAAAAAAPAAAAVVVVDLCQYTDVDFSLVDQIRTGQIYHASRFDCHRIH